MNYESKHRKRLLALAVVTIVAIASVSTAYAVLIATFTGGEVTIGGDTTGTITYSTDKETYSPTLCLPDSGSQWYTKLTIDGGSQYAGQTVTITWILQQKTGDNTWTDGSALPSQTTITLPSYGALDVYTSPTGVSNGVFDWSLISSNGVYRVVTTVESTP